MIEIPIDFDFSFVVGCTLLQLGIGQNEIILNFDSKVHILVEVSIKLKTPDNRIIICNAQGSDCVGIPKLLGKQVIKCGRVDSKTMKVEFEDGSTLEMSDAKQFHESYSVMVDMKRVLVV
jgi:hypothetical protein